MSIRAVGSGLMALNDQARELATLIMRRHGRVTEAIFVEPTAEGQVHLSDDTAITIKELGFLFFGYSGTGSSAFSAFLSAMGFVDSDVSNIRGLLKLLPDGRRINGERQDGQIKWEDGTTTDLLPPGWKYEYPPRPAQPPPPPHPVAATTAPAPPPSTPVGQPTATLKMKTRCVRCGQKMTITSRGVFYFGAGEPNIVKLRCEQCNITRFERKPDIEKELRRTLPHEFTLQPQEY